MAAWTELPPTGGLPECAALVQLAERLRWSAAELVIQYANRALAESAAQGGPLAVRAQALVAAALVRLGRHAEAVEPALVALRDADEAGVPELVPAIRLDLAASAHGLGESLLGCTILRPVLENLAGRPSTRAVAIAALVGCTAHVGRRDDLEDSLAEAERLLAADDALTPDARRMERAQLAMRTAAYYRRYGETEDAVDAARDGLGLLTKLRDPRLEGGLAKAGLTLELVCALLDDGELAEAERVAEPLLAEPVRSASAAAVGRLMLAMVTRVHVPAGRVEHGRSLLGHATWIAERHDHDWLLADAHTTLAQLDEASGQPADALIALRAARVAEQRQLRRADAAKRQLMIEFGARPMPLDTVNSLLRNVIRAPVSAAPASGMPAMLPPARPPAPPVQVAGKPADPEPADTDAATGLLTRAGLSRRIEAVRSTNRPVALTLVRLDPVDGEGRTDQDAATADGPAPDALTTLAGRVRDMAPEDAELARSDGSELAVLLPHTTRDEAEEFAATIRESAIESDWLTEASGQEVSISTGVAQSGPATDEDADSLLTAARETFTTAEADRPPPTAPEAPSSDDLFLSTLDAAAGDAGAGYQEIRDLLAPLLGHPTLKRADPTPSQSGDLPTPPAPDPTGPEPDSADSSGDRSAQDAESGRSAEPEPDTGDRERGTSAERSAVPEAGSPTSWSDRLAHGADSGRAAFPESDPGEGEEGTAVAGWSSTPEVGTAGSWGGRFAQGPDSGRSAPEQDVGDGEQGSTAAGGRSLTPEVGSAESWVDRLAQGADSGRSTAPEPDAGDGGQDTAAAGWASTSEGGSAGSWGDRFAHGAESGRAAFPESDAVEGEEGVAAAGRSLTPEDGSAGSWGDRFAQGADSERSAAPEQDVGDWEQGSTAAAGRSLTPEVGSAGSWSERVAQGADSGRSASADPDAGQGEPGTAAAGRSWGGRGQGTADGWSSSAERDRGSSGLWRELTAGLGEADVSGSWRGLVAQRTETGTRSTESDSQPTLPLQRRQMVPGESEPDDIPEVPEPARRGNIILPKEPDGVPSPPNEPDGIPPEPGRAEPLPEVPPPARIQPEPQPETQPEQPEPETEVEPPSPQEQSRLEAALGPVHGPEPRVDDLPRRPDRSLRRPERSDRTSIAELLTEALVAYQETTPDEEPEPAPEPVSHERMDLEHTESRPSGRHRLPDWDGGV